MNIHPAWVQQKGTQPDAQDTNTQDTDTQDKDTHDEGMKVISFLRQHMNSTHVTHLIINYLSTVYFKKHQVLHLV